MKNLKILFTLPILCILFACSGDKGDSLIEKNLFADAGRTNNYEKYGTLYSSSYYVDKIDFPDSSGSMISPLPISAVKVIMATVNGTVLSVLEGKVEWSYRLDSNLIVCAGMCADKNDNVYFISNEGTICSLDKSGKLRWKINPYTQEKTQLVFSDLLAVRDGIYSASNNGILYKLDNNGKIQWQRKYDLTIPKVLTADSTGNLVISLTNNNMTLTDSLTMIDSKGNTIWTKPFEKVRLIKNPVIANDKILLSGIAEVNQQRVSIFYSMDFKGNILWKKELTVLVKNISVAGDGTIYLSCFNSGLGETLSALFCFKNDGTLEWKQYLEYSIPSPIMLSKDKIACVGTKRNTIGVFFFDLKGTLIKLVSMSDAPSVYLIPSVKPDPVIIFTGQDRLCLVRIDDSAISKVTPW